MIFTEKNRVTHLRACQEGKESGHILKIKYSHKGAETRRESEGRGEDGRRPTDEGREDEWMIRMVG